MERRREYCASMRKIEYLRSWSKRDTQALRLFMRELCPNLEVPPSYLMTSDLPYLLMVDGNCEIRGRNEPEITEFEIHPTIQWPSLKNLQMNFLGSGPNHLATFLERCPNLKRITIRDPPALGEYGLHNLNNLQSLFTSRGRCFRLYPDSLVDSILPDGRVPCFLNLQRLHFFNTRLPPSLLPTLGRIKSLQKLLLQSVKIREVNIDPKMNFEEEHRLNKAMGSILQDLISALPELKRFEITDTAWKEPFELAICHPKLLRLNLVEEPSQYAKAKPPFKMTVTDIQCPQLRKCTIQLAAMDSAAISRVIARVREGSPWVHNVEGCVLQTELSRQRSGQPIPASFPQSVWDAPLVKVRLVKCLNLDQTGVEAFISRLWRLRSLRIEKCKGITTINNCHNPSLHFLSLSGNGFTGDMEFRGTSSFPNLRTAKLALGRNVTSLSVIDLPNLATLRLTRSKPTGSLRQLIVKNVPRLRSLEVSWFPPMEFISIEAERLTECRSKFFFAADSLSVKCPALTYLELEARLWTNKENDLRAIVEGCPMLEGLDIVRVRGLSKEFLQQVADSPSAENLVWISYLEAPSEEASMSPERMLRNEEATLDIVPTRLKDKQEKENNNNEDQQEKENNKEEAN